jgi:hypothetical protein
MTLSEGFSCEVALTAGSLRKAAESAEKTLSGDGPQGSWVVTLDLAPIEQYWLSAC